MNIERLTIALRPRSGWEALDLGLRLAQAHAGALWRTWWALSLPVALVTWLACRDEPLWAMWILWWLKPLADRFMLHVLAQAVFGEAPTLAATLGAWRRVLGPGLMSTLLWRRWDPARSFFLPVAQLEGQTGRAARERRRVLGRNTWGMAVWLSLSARLFGVVLFLATVVLALLLNPDDYAQATWLENLGTWSHADNLLSYLVLSAIEPLYVACGFMLYLNRRVELEGWDVELALKRMQSRVTQRRGTALASLLVLASLSCALLGSALMPATAWAQTSGADAPASAPGQVAPDDGQAPPSAPAAAIRKVLAQPDFGGTRDVTEWEYIPEEERKKPDNTQWDWLMRLGKLAAKGGQLIGWVLLALAIIGLIGLSLRTWARRERSDAPGKSAPSDLFGLQIAPHTLPDDIAQAARERLAAGDLRGALSLLYRGALSQLVHRHGLSVQGSDTEEDVMRHVPRLLDASASEVFRALVRAWQVTAYAGRPAQGAEVERLCNAWPAAFASDTSRAGASSSGVAS